MAIEGVENGSVESGVGEGDVLVAQARDAIGVVGAVEICGSTGESGDAAGIDGA